jgi:uncharacterized repeat protein (TIGR03943 family)
VSEDARATTVLLVGALMIRLAVGGAYAKYVRAGMGPLLLIAGILLAGLGLFGVVRALRRRGRSDDDAHGGHAHGEGPHGEDAHGHHHSDRIGWLLLAPVLALLLVTPPTLGSFGVNRSAAVSVTSGGKVFSPLPAGRTVPMTLLEFDERTADHKGASFGSTQVRLTGFVTPSSDRQGFRLARYQIACCAADAVASVVRITGSSGSKPARDQWVTVTGTFNPAADGVPELHAVSLAEIPTPLDPYE